MNASRILAALRARRAVFVDRLPAPMAAPETPRLRALRISLVVHLGLLAIITTAWGPIAASRFATIGALAWLCLALGALVVGTFWLVLKIRADHAWISREREP